MEKIVRPFQSPPVPGRRIPTEQTVPAEPVKLEIGRNGSGKNFATSASVNQSFYCEAHQVEQRR